MDDQTKKEFLRVLEKTMGAYAKPLPEKSVSDSWIEMLTPFPVQIIQAACVAYIADNDIFPPVPAAIYNRCKLLDGRPGAEEAWALALTSRDEADTVVWTCEIAEAFDIARPVLDSSGAISARKTFLEAYERIVSRARLYNRPAQWMPSIGWDLSRRAAALNKAISSGYLTTEAKTECLALMPPVGEPARNDAAAHAQIARIKEMMASMAAEKALEIELHKQREREQIADRKAELEAMTQACSLKLRIV